MQVVYVETSIVSYPAAAPSRDLIVAAHQPGKARADIPHFAFAVSYEVDYLVTWNCSHIANGEMIRRLMKVNGELKRPTPLIVTPEEISELLEDQEL
jgi:hypothetical protein